jgi:hypothetical protein
MPKAHPLDTVRLLERSAVQSSIRAERSPAPANTLYREAGASYLNPL